MLDQDLRAKVQFIRVLMHLSEIISNWPDA